MRPPTVEDLDQAIQWLEANEGDPVQRDPMIRVAVWLREQIKVAHRAQFVRQAEKIGVFRGAAIKKARALWP
jgi:CubicO group peptidase (beta-lactamase class C family)